MTRLEYAVNCSNCEPEEKHIKAAILLSNCCPDDVSDEECNGFCHGECLPCWLSEHKEE